MGNTTIPAELVAINAIQGTLIADNAITSVHIAQNNVTAVQLAINSVTATQIADGTITSAKIQDGTIATADIADVQITTAKLADNSVTSAKIVNASIVSADIANNAILTQHIDDNQITADQIADNAVGLGQMAGLTRGSIIYGDSAGDPAYLAAGTSGHVLTSDGTDISWTADTDLFLATTGGTITGDLTISEATPTLKFTDTDNNYDATIAGLSGSLVLTADSGAEIGTETIQFHTGGSSTLTLDASQNASFAGTVTAVTAAGTTAEITVQETSGATTSLKAGGAVGYVGTYSDHPFRIVTNAGTKIYVATDGKIGIGSNHTNPLQTVDISGSAAGLNLQGGNNRIYFSNYRALEGATDASLLQIGEQFADIALQGDVAIGTTDPSTSKLRVYNSTVSGNTRLHVHNDKNGDAAELRLEGKRTSNNDTGQLLYVNSGNVVSRISANSSADDGDLRFYTSITGTGQNVSEAIRITSNGNLQMIGQTSTFANPGFTYHTNNYLYCRGGSAGLILSDDSGINTVQIIDGASGYIRFETADGSEKMRIDASGNVGIGLAGTAASQKLHVNSGGTNVVARFESTDAIAGIMLKDNTGNVELESYDNMFRVNPGGAANPYSFQSSATSNYFTTTTSHSGTNQDFDFTILNSSGSNHGPRVRLYGGGQSSGVASDVPWDNQQGYNTSSLWFDSGEGPSIYGAGIAGYAEEDFNANDTPAALAFYTTPNGTGGQTNTAKERLRLRADGTAHFSPSESDTRIYIGSQGGLTGGNSSNWVRASGSTLMYNCGGGSSSHIWEVAGTQKLQVTNAYMEQRTNQSDQYTLRSRNTASGDPGLSLTRDNVVGFGIAVRGATDDYADFQVNNAGATSYTETGKLRLYSSGNVSIPGTALWSTGVGNTFGTTGNHYMIRTSSSTGNETLIINNTQAGSVGVLQYRESGGVRGTFYVADTSNGIYSTSSSDYRFKENVTTITDDHLTKLTSLRPITYTHSADYDTDTSTVHTGFIAHEVEGVFPEFVDGEKDAVWTQEELEARGDPDTTNETAGDPKYQTIAYERKEWNVYIIRALQQLKAENDALKARIEALEG